MNLKKSYGKVNSLEPEFTASGMQFPEKKHPTIHVHAKLCQFGPNLALIKYAA